MENSRGFEPVTNLELSDSESSHNAKEQRTVLCRKAVRKRHKHGPSVKERLVDKAVCRNLVNKSCPGTCRNFCLRQFAGKEAFSKLLEFRKAWNEMHKLDCDQVVTCLMLDSVQLQSTEELFDVVWLQYKRGKYGLKISSEYDIVGMGHGFQHHVNTDNPLFFIFLC